MVRCSCSQVSVHSFSESPVWAGWLWLAADQSSDGYNFFTSLRHAILAHQIYRLIQIGGSLLSYEGKNNCLIHLKSSVLNLQMQRQKNQCIVLWASGGKLTKLSLPCSKGLLD